MTGAEKLPDDQFRAKFETATASRLKKQEEIYIENCIIVDQVDEVSY